MILHGKTAGDERLHGFGPALREYAEIPNRSFESVAAGVHGAENHLILEHEITHHQVGIDLDWGFATRDAGENKNPIGAELLDHVKSKTGGAGRFVYQIDVADLPSH